MRLWAGVLAMVSVATLGLSGCGGDSSQSDDASLSLEWTFTPTTATAVASDEAYEWMAPYRVTLRETGGRLGGTFTNVIVNVYENVDGEAGAEGQGNTILQYESTRIDAGATTALDFTTHYTLANEGKAAVIDVFVFLRDDEGFEAQIGRRLAVQ